MSKRFEICFRGCECSPPCTLFAISKTCKCVRATNRHTKMDAKLIERAAAGGGAAPSYRESFHTLSKPAPWVVVQGLAARAGSAASSTDDAMVADDGNSSGPPLERDEEQMEDAFAMAQVMGGAEAVVSG